uniref:TEP-1 n=1 Tax=Reishia clavigera TaxID=272940 RepID=A0A0C6E0T9_REICL|nr:TEP-1 precursor [Reishia clavigera]
MTTRGSCVMCAAMMSLLILSSIVSNAEGKCSGKWAIHACWGGNGKRSGIPAEEDDNTAKSLDLLRRLLRRKVSSSPYLPSLEDTVYVPVQPEDFLSSSESLPSSLSSSSSLLSSSSPFEDGFSEDVEEAEAAAASFVPSKNRLASLTTILRKLQQGRDDFQ